MDPEEILEEERRDILNQIRLDLLLRRLGTTVLRRKFMEFYAKLNDGKEWKDGPEAGEKFCQSKWGNDAYVNAQVKQQEMMEEGNIQFWDLHCLQSVITQMLTVVLKENQTSNNNGTLKKSASSESAPAIWDPSWWTQMSKIRKLSNIRNSIAHMPNGTLSQSEFDETWREAVHALKALGAKSKEIKEILQVTQSAFSLPSFTQQAQDENSGKEASKKIKEDLEEERITIAELQTKIKELQLKIQSQVKEQKLKDEAKGQLKKELKSVNPVVINKKNEWEAKSLTGNGDLECRSGDWDKAIEFYTKALEIPDISDDLRMKIYLNRSWVHLKILEMPEPPFDLNVSEFETKKKSGGKFPSQSQNNAKTQRESKFVDEELLEMDNQKWPEKLTKEMQEFHLTAGIADAESALQLSPGQKSPKVYYRLAQFHQLKGDWKIALTFFDLALDQSDLDDSQLEFDRNVCQLEVLNQTEVEEFNWIPGQKNQTMAGLAVLRNPQIWSKVMDETMNDPQQQQQLYAQVVKGHFIAQGLSWEDEAQNQNKLEVTHQTFEKVVKLYEGAAKGGLPSGLYNLGILLQEGNGVHHADFSGAVRLFKMAARFPIHHQDDPKTSWCIKDGVLEAQYRLGLCYEFGLGVSKDDKKALHWFEMASLGDLAKASRKLGDIYSQGLLGVSKDQEMALLCWYHASNHGDAVGITTAILHILPSLKHKVIIENSIKHFEMAINCTFLNGTDTMIASVLSKKLQFQSVLSAILEELSQTPSNSKKTEAAGNEKEFEGAAWNISALTEHTLRTIHLLELTQTREFKQKLQVIPDWESQLIFSNRLVTASNFCIEGLAAFQELNKLYRDFMLKGYLGSDPVIMVYPPSLQGVPGGSADQIRSPSILKKQEDQLVTVIINSFGNSVKLVGASFFMDQPTQSLIQCLARSVLSTPVPETRTPEVVAKYHNATILLWYVGALKHNREEYYKQLEQRCTPTEDDLPDPFIVTLKAAFAGSVKNFGMASQIIEKFWKSPVQPSSDPYSIRDLIFIQALGLKSAALSRGVNSVNRKKIKEAMANFRKFLTICPKDEPRRAEAHYQVALCTLYLEKMKVKGQVKGHSSVSVSSSTAQDILNKVMPDFCQGETAEQEVPWKEFQLPDKSPVKLFVQQKIQELEALAGNGTSDLEREEPESGVTKSGVSSGFGRIIDPGFLFSTSSFRFKIQIREARRVRVVTKFRKFFNAIWDAVGSSPSSHARLYNLISALESSASPCKGPDVFTRSDIVGCYEIVEPLLMFSQPANFIQALRGHTRYTRKTKNAGVGEQLQLQLPGNLEDSKTGVILAFTVIQDENGAVFHLTLRMNHPGEEVDERWDRFGVGKRIIISQPSFRLDEDGGISMMVNNAEEIFHLQKQQQEEQQGNGGEMKKRIKCGFCGEFGETLQQCAKCQVVYYCGKECQAADWNELKHKWICPFLKYQDPPRYFSLPVLRSGI